VAKKIKQRLPFDNDGGTVVFPKKLFESVAYCHLTPTAKCLIPLLQTFWRNGRTGSCREDWLHSCNGRQVFQNAAISWLY